MMPYESGLLGEIEVEIFGFFTTHHAFRVGTGSWGELTCPAFREEATFRWEDGSELVMRKAHWLGTAYEMLEGESVRGTADRRGFFSRDFLIDLDGQAYLLAPEGWLEKSWHLTDAVGQTLLEIRPRGIMRQGAYMTSIGRLNRALVVFAYYLVFMRGQEDTAAVAAVSSSAAS